MKTFEDLQTVWKQNDGAKSVPQSNFSTLRSQKQKMRNKSLFTAFALVLTGIFVLTIMNSLDTNIQSITVMAAMIFIAITCWLQALLQFINARKLDDIDETLPPKQLLQQWQNYRTFQKKQSVWNMPLYYILLGTALGFYLFEIIKNASVLLKTIVFTVTYGWMLFAYFYLGKRQIKKHNSKIDTMIEDLKELENQFE